mmetsp:Transcript_130717/g.326134  ORF Transcript_130717/g.326134 Transcript_130717/m.326134 type:complete len:252 (+) Transcript_130717:82-837(+)
MALTWGAAVALSMAALRVSAQGPNIRNGDALTQASPFTDEVRDALFKAGSQDVEWMFALSGGSCADRCKPLVCAEGMFEKVNTQHAYNAIMETIDGAPGCSSWRVDTEYHVAPFYWEDEAQCWVSGEKTKASCDKEADPQFTDVRLCPCVAHAGKHAKFESTDELESTPVDEEEALSLGKKKALENLDEVRSAPVISESLGSKVSASIAALAAVIGASGLGFVAFRAHQHEASARLLVPAEEEGAAGGQDC